MVGGGSRQWQTHTHKHTHTHSVPRATLGGWSLGQELDAILTHVGVAHPLIELIGYEHWEDAVDDGGSRQWLTNTHTHTHRVPRDTHGRWSLGQGSDAMLAHVGVARTLIELVGYDHREDAVVGGGSRQWQTQAHTHTVFLVKHRADGASGRDWTQS